MNQASQKNKNLKSDEKQKKKLDAWGYGLAWLAFFAGLAAAFVTLANKSVTPKKNDYYK